MEWIVNKIMINEVNFVLYGNEIVNDTDKIQILKNVKQNIKIPNQFNFNCNWKINFKCIHCENILEVGQDFEKKEIGINKIENLNSKFYNSKFLEFFLTIFDNIEIREVDNVCYINRKDFYYEFDFQRSSSVAPVYLFCNHCNSEYLLKIRIGLPQFPERNNIFGEWGKVEIDEIINVKMNGGKMFIELLNENNLEYS